MAFARGAWTGIRSTLMALPPATRAKHGPNLRPDSFRMIAKKGRPGLPSWMQHTSLLHVLLDGSLTHAHTQLEQFATHAFSTPKPVVLGHLFD